MFYWANKILLLCARLGASRLGQSREKPLESASHQPGPRGWGKKRTLKFTWITIVLARTDCGMWCVVGGNSSPANLLQVSSNLFFFA
ncbi:hypothetical protein GGS26DRAFT_539292 [Hypomontagnella submonticulosa]|nr:hypothetical protein GGS26DRAFT_539292 [Hypomontagnella submonticulosa]